MADLVGKTMVNRYRIEDSLGSGGMAEVYKAWDQQRATYLALKMMRPELAEDLVFLRRFQREAQTLEKLQHPNIVRFYGIEKDDLHVFMLMEYIEGTTLQRVLFRNDGKPLSIDYVGHVMQSLCSALHYAHHMKMVHCDIKPANIMINEAGMVLLTDFGIARFTDTATSSLSGFGTPAYMAPDLIRGYAPTPQSDIYALGVVLYGMVTGGERPFTGEKAQIPGPISEKVRWEQVNLEPPAPRTYNPDISAGLQNVILTCLRKSPVDRFQNVSDLWNALVRATGVEPISAGFQEDINSNIPAVLPNYLPPTADPKESIGVVRENKASPPYNIFSNPKTKRILTISALFIIPLLIITMMLANGLRGRGLLGFLAERTPQSFPTPAEIRLPVIPPTSTQRSAAAFIPVSPPTAAINAPVAQATNTNWPTNTSMPQATNTSIPAVTNTPYQTPTPISNEFALTVINEHCYPIDLFINGVQKATALSGYGTSATLSLTAGAYSVEYCEILSPDCVSKAINIQANETLIIPKEPRCPATSSSQITIQVINYDCYGYDIYIGGVKALTVPAGGTGTVAWNQGTYEVSVCHISTTTGCSDEIYPLYSDDHWEFERQAGCTN